MLKLFKTKKRVKTLYDNVEVRDYLPQYLIAKNRKRSIKPIIATISILIVCTVSICMLIPLFTVKNDSLVNIKIDGLVYTIPLNNEKINEYDLPRAISTDMLGEKIGIMNSDNICTEKFDKEDLPGILLGKGIYKCKGKESNAVLIIGDEDVGYYYFLFTDYLYYKNADNTELKRYSMRNTFELFGCYNYTDIVSIEVYTVVDNQKEKKICTLDEKEDIKNFYNIIISLEAMNLDSAFSRYDDKSDLIDIKQFKVNLNNSLNLFLKLEKNHMFRSYAYYDSTNVEVALDEIYSNGKPLKTE